MSFWADLRAELQASRQSKPKTERFILAARDRTYAIACGYGWLRRMIIGGEYPTCTEPNVADSLFKLSCILRPWC